MKLGTLKTNKNKIGPKILPCNANEVPTPVAKILNVPQIKLSPIPANGPMIAVLTLEIEVVSKFSMSFARCSSIATVIPNGNVIHCGVVLKNSK